MECTVKEYRAIGSIFSTAARSAFMLANPRRLDFRLLIRSNDQPLERHNGCMAPKDSIPFTKTGWSVARFPETSGGLHSPCAISVARIHA